MIRRRKWKEIHVKGVGWFVSFLLVSGLCFGMALPSLASSQANPQIRSTVFTQGEAVNEAASQEVTEHGGIAPKELVSVLVRYQLSVLLKQSAKQHC